MTRRRLALCACVLAAAAPGLAGCGGGSPRGGIPRALAALRSAAAAGDARTACPRLLFVGPRTPRREIVGYLRALRRPGGAANLAAVTAACGRAFAQPRPAARLLGALRVLTRGRVREIAAGQGLGRVMLGDRAGVRRRLTFARVRGGWRLLLSGRLSAG